MMILAIESSCDETAAAVIESSDNDIAILSNVVSSQINLHKKFGGVYPEIASRAHVEKIIAVIEQAIGEAEGLPLSECRLTEPEGRRNRVDRVAGANGTNRGRLNNIDVITVTSGPGLIGSLLVGVNTAKTLAFAQNKPIIPINHWLGHIYSCFTREISKSEFLISKQIPNSKSQIQNNPTIQQLNNSLPQFPLLALIVSGGHTGLVLMKSHTDYETIGQTLDDAAGEAFDKVAKLLQLGYPGGPAISEAAERYKKQDTRNKQIPNIKFPRSMLDRPDFNFSFSGLKTSVLYKVKYLTENCKLKIENFAPVVAHEFQQTVIDILIGKTLQAAQKYHPKSILLCGGVSANKELRSQMKSAIKQFSNPTISFFVPPLSLTTDNAAMIGIAAAYQIAHGIKPATYENINANANLKL